MYDKELLPKIVKVSELRDAIYKHQHPVYMVTAEDIEGINKIIISAFAEELRLHPDAKRTKLSGELTRYMEPVYESFAQFYYGRNEKAEALTEEVNILLNDAGFYTAAINGKGLYLCISLNAEKSLKYEQI